MTGLRYLAILDPGRARGDLATDAPPDLELAFQSESLAVYASRSAETISLGASGIALGSLFNRGCAAPVRKLGSGTPPSLARTLIDQCWGDYVAFITDPPNASVHIVRAPSGGLHAFRAKRGPLTFLASDIELLQTFGLASPAVNWAFVAHHLAFSHLHTNETGIADVDEVMPGDCVVERSSHSERTNLWSPWNFARRADHAAFDDAARAVRGAILQAVEALVTPSDKVALELSGGLDSSIVAAALAQTGRNAIAVNLTTPGPEGDERHYARAVGERCSLPLIEQLVEGDIDLTESAAAIEPRPGMLAMLRLADRQFAAIGQDHNVTGFINGTGGDCVFCSLGTVAPAADRLHAEGIGSGLLRSIRDVAEIHNANLWKVGRLTMAKRRGHRPRPIWRRNSHFLNSENLPTEPAQHPWLVEPDDALGGTRAHIHAILASYSHLDGYGRQHIAPSIFPLLSQPVVEACVAIPSWLWVTGGRDRAVARAAFRGLLPDITINRRTKGGMEAFCARTFEINRARLQPFLLDGDLADAGLLDRPAIEAYLTRPFVNRDALFYHLLPIADTERWVRSVVSSAADPAPAMARQR